jgi:hypothetical protein
MARSNTATIGDLRRERSQPDALAQAASDSPSAVSWASIFAGAAGAASLSLILLILGTGLGLSSVSPWAHDGVSKITFGVSTILWVTFTQLVASGMGGYLAGRLRTRWVEVQRDEIYFRDTVHGFLAWAVSSLVTATLLTSVVASITNSSVQAGPSATGKIATTAVTAVVGADSAKTDDGTGSLDYFIDSLFRKDTTVALTATPVPLVEVGRIFMTNIHTVALPAQDLRYVGQLVTQHTSLPQQAAEKRVSDTYARVQARWHDAQTATAQAADAARKASAYASLWLFVALLSGAFVASLAATAGGRQRDA